MALERRMWATVKPSTSDEQKIEEKRKWNEIWRKNGTIVETREKHKQKTNEIDDFQNKAYLS